MKMTLFVDASWCPTTKVGGVGAWVKKDGWAKGSSFGGVLERKTQSSTEAELLAIAQVFDFVQKYNELGNVDNFILQSDCLYALHSLVKFGGFIPAKPRHLSDADVSLCAHLAHDRHNDLVARIEEVTRGVRFRQVRHVKAHREGENSRSWVNETCDTLAKEYMRAERIKAYHGAGMGHPRVRQRSEVRKLAKT